MPDDRAKRKITIADGLRRANEISAVLDRLTIDRRALNVQLTISGLCRCMNNNSVMGALAWLTGEAPPTDVTSSEINSSYIIVIIITVFASVCLLIAAPIVFATLKSKKKAQRSGKYDHSHMYVFSAYFP